MEAYKSWVRRHGTLLSILETGLSSLTWVLPDRFNDNELSLEAVHTAINLLSAFHDIIANEGPSGAPRFSAELSFALTALQQVQVLVELWGLHAESQATISSAYDPLIAVEGLKVLVRLAIYRAANVRILTNGGVSAFEGLHASSLMGGGHQQEQRARQVFGAFASFREKHCFVPVGDEDTPGEARGPTAAGAAAAAAPQDETKKERTGDGVGDTKHTSITDADRLIKAERRDDIVDATEEERLVEKNKESADVGGNVNDRPQDEDERLLLWWDRPAARKVPRQMGDSPGPLQPGLRRVQSAAALSLLGQKTGVAQAMAAKLLVSGEILHVLRPLIYVSALRRWGRRSWKPWLISLVTELVAARLTSMGADVSRKSAMQAAEDPAVVGTAMARLYALQGLRWRHDEADEFLRRRAALLLYLLRDPFFSNLTGPAVMRWKGRLGRLPVVGWGVEKAAELLVGVQKYYTYVGSS